MNKNISGFTIIELIVTIVIIGILAAITIVAYNGVQNRGYDAAVKTDLAMLADKYDISKTYSATGVYPFGATLHDDSIEAKISKGAYAISPTVDYNLLNCTNSATPGSDYAILAISKSGKKLYVSSATSGVKEYTGGTAWGAVTMCTTVLAGSVGNGAGYATATGWRTWTD